MNGYVRRRGSDMFLVPAIRSGIVQGLASSIEPCAARSSSGVSQCRTYAMGGESSMHSTTVLCVRKDQEVLMVADGQVTFGSSILKPNVRKTRRLGSQHVIGGFAGATADAFTLFERLESKLEEHPGQLMRAAVELAKMWRMDKYLRRLDASLIVADKDLSLQITGNGDVLEPHDGVLSIGSGSPYALAAARALMDIPGLDATEVAKRAMKIAADSCIYTNSNFTVMRIGKDGHVVEDASL